MGINRGFRVPAVDVIEGGSMDYCSTGYCMGGDMGYCGIDYYILAIINGYYRDQ
ncbi:hypothetical protein COTS27_01104 [Spirochaetota bacterium]|nr:hypothetical protein COTS27_01104 [Spirochaetota bacterium]